MGYQKVEAPKSRSEDKETGRRTIELPPKKFDCIASHFFVTIKKLC
jgi:hypothetical protein